MTCLRRWLLTALATAGLGTIASAAAPDPAALAARIDALVAARWAAEGVRPAGRADDSAFLRRVYLDLVGRVPTAAEARQFLADVAPDRRARLADALLASPAHARHAAGVWRREWIPQADTPQFAGLGDDFEGWLAGQFRERAGVDSIARALLTASPAAGDAPAAFLNAGEFRPENLAANAARAFLGVNLDCAQCHDHPFARWTREQFWETAAFFARPSAAGTFEIAVPGRKAALAPRLLDDSPVAWPKRVAPDGGRAALARWATARGNPYFARNAVNRAWAHLFGTGLVEPLDDLSGPNPAAHPEVLDELAAAFEASGFDLALVYATLARTEAYQLASNAPGASTAHDRLFARAPVRGLTGEQLYDSLRVAAGLPPERGDLDPTGAGQARKRFSATFRVERPGSAQRSILQALSLMNNPHTAGLTDPARTPTLRAADAPFLDAGGRLEALFLAALSRRPTAAEQAELSKSADPPAALADLFWALLNSAEFNTNH